MQQQKKDDSQQESNGQLNGTSTNAGDDGGSFDESLDMKSQNGFADNEKSSNLSNCDRNMVRIIGQHLLKMGLKKSAEMLIAESGCRLDHPATSKLKECIVEGDWCKADTALNELQSILKNPESLLEMKFLLLEEKYLELLEAGKYMDALTCLRSQITPLGHKEDRVHHLSSLMCVTDVSELHSAANWMGTGKESRGKLMEKLHQFLPPSVMLPPNRLETLIVQAVQHQLDNCFFHNTTLDSEYLAQGDSLLIDHTCSKDILPTHTVQILEDHTDEVLIAKFSPDGTKLASGSKDSSVIIWDVNLEEFFLKKKLSIQLQQYGVSFIAWSPDSTKIIVCMNDEASELLVYSVERGEQICKVTNTPEDSLTCAAWHKDSKKFACGGVRGQFYLCDLEGHINKTWEGVRVHCLAYHKDGRTILASDTHHRIRGYQLEEEREHDLIQEDHSIMGFSIDSSGRYALVSVSKHGIHLWDLEDRALVRKFRGLTQGHYVIHACFGGQNENFIASGSEDRKVYIWRRQQELPIAVLSGHTYTVNCVSWNPAHPGMLASCSDDRTIRIWGSASQCANNIVDSQNGCASNSDGGEVHNQRVLSNGASI